MRVELTWFGESHLCQLTFFVLHQVCLTVHLMHACWSDASDGTEAADVSDLGQLEEPGG